MTCVVHLSAGHEERAKPARLEALPREEGSNRVRRHRQAERPRPSGERGSGRLKKKWTAAWPAGRWADWAENEEKEFLN
jgi:hypothetical protein